jgi:hypothetical protein
VESSQESILTIGGLSKQFWISVNKEIRLHNRPGSTFRALTFTTDCEDLWLRVTRDEIRIWVVGTLLKFPLRNRERWEYNIQMDFGK